MPICGYCKKVRGKASKVAKHLRTCRTDLRWGEVSELRRAGSEKKADELVLEIFGIENPVVPMPQETKDHLKEYRQTHKEEIKQKKREKKERAKIAKAREVKQIRALQGKRKRK